MPLASYKILLYKSLQQVPPILILELFIELLRSNFPLCISLSLAMHRNLQPLAFSAVRSSLTYGSSLYLGPWAFFDFISLPKVPRDGTLMYKFTSVRLAYTILIHSFNDICLAINFQPCFRIHIYLTYVTRRGIHANNSWCL